jgi:hypothetical protein
LGLGKVAVALTSHRVDITISAIDQVPAVASGCFRVAPADAANKTSCSPEGLKEAYRDVYTCGATTSKIPYIVKYPAAIIMGDGFL